MSVAEPLGWRLFGPGSTHIVHAVTEWGRLEPGSSGSHLAYLWATVACGLRGRTYSADVWATKPTRQCRHCCRVLDR